MDFDADKQARSDNSSARNRTLLREVGARAMSVINARPGATVYRITGFSALAALAREFENPTT